MHAEQPSTGQETRQPRRAGTRALHAKPPSTGQAATQRVAPTRPFVSPCKRAPAHVAWASHPPGIPATTRGQNLRGTGKMHARQRQLKTCRLSSVCACCAARGSRALALRKARHTHPLHNSTQLAFRHCIQPVRESSKGQSRRSPEVTHQAADDKLLATRILCTRPARPGQLERGRASAARARCRSRWRTGRGAHVRIHRREPRLQLHRGNARCAWLHHLCGSAVQRC